MSESGGNENVRIGIGVIAATAGWIDNAEAADRILANQIDDLIAERGQHGIVQIIDGLTEVACMLLLDLAAATGRSKEDILQEIAVKHQA